VSEKEYLITNAKKTETPLDAYADGFSRGFLLFAERRLCLLTFVSYSLRETLNKSCHGRVIVLPLTVTGPRRRLTFLSLIGFVAYVFANRAD